MATSNNNKDYSQLTDPYDAHLMRGGSSATPNGQFSNQNGNGNTETQPVKSDGAMSDVWIRNFIRSEHWTPKKNGFYIDGRTGYAEFSNVYVSGNIEALSGTIGGFNIESDRLTVTSGGNTTMISSGAGGIDVIQAGPTGAPTFWVGSTGTMYAANGSFSGSIFASSISGTTITGGTITGTTVIGSTIKTASSGQRIEMYPVSLITGQSTIDFYDSSGTFHGYMQSYGTATNGGININVSGATMVVANTGGYARAYISSGSGAIVEVVYTGVNITGHTILSGGVFRVPRYAAASIPTYDADLEGCIVYDTTNALFKVCANGSWRTMQTS